MKKSIKQKNKDVSSILGEGHFSALEMNNFRL